MRKRRMGTVAGAGVGGAFAAACGIAVMASSPATTGCTTHQCDPSFTDFPSLTDDVGARGFMIDENTFVTVSLVDGDAGIVGPTDGASDGATDAATAPSTGGGAWIGYPGNGTLRIWFPPEVAGRIPIDPICYVGIGQNPNSPTAADVNVNYTMAVGQLALFNDLNTRFTRFSDAAAFGGSFEVKNDTCQFYYLRCVVNFVPVDAAPDADDASADADSATISSDPATDDAATE